MRYIKINKPSLDYNQFSDFHAFTMNNLVRNVMRNGKYKKAVKLVRLGLLYGLKELFVMFDLTDERVSRTFYPLPRTYLTEKTKDDYFLNLTELRLRAAESNEVSVELKYNELDQQLLDNADQFKNFTDFYNHFFNSYFKNIKSKFSPIQLNNMTPKIIKTIPLLVESKRANLLIKYNNIKQLAKEQTQIAYENQLKRHIVINQFDKASFQYHKLEKLKFIKLYTKKQHIYYYGIRDLTVFDMVLQVYTMLTGAWYMRKAKVSGRTILIPSPLRPYRRIVNVTKMLLKGIEKRRHIQRSKKNAMIDAFGTEFCWLLFYNGFQYTPTNNFANSDVWAEKMASHKELVANLKNIKYLKYF